jgi:hypothetical protein
MALPSQGGEREFAPVDEEQVRRYVVARLAEGIHPGDIILKVCETQGLDWRQGENLVNEIAASATGDVARRRFPLFALLALGIIVAGVALMASFAASVLTPFMFAGGEMGQMPVTEAGTLLGWLMVNLEAVGQAILGAAMIAGGAVGLHRVMRETLEM